LFAKTSEVGLTPEVGQVYGSVPILS